MMRRNLKMPKFEILQNTICDGWVNTWTSNDMPEYFDSFEDAVEELDTFLMDTQESFEQGYLSSMYKREEFKIVEVKNA
jgi:hypothetical protein